MRRECRERFPRHQLQRKPRVSDPGMYHGTCVTHVPWYMLGSLTRSSGENVPGIPCAYATRNFMYLVRGPLRYLPTGTGYYLMMVETNKRPGSRASLYTPYLLMNDTCLEMFYYFLGDAKTKLAIYAYSEDQQVCARNKTCCSGGHYWDCHPGPLSSSFCNSFDDRL